MIYILYPRTRGPLSIEDRYRFIYRLSDTIISRNLVANIKLITIIEKQSYNRYYWLFFILYVEAIPKVRYDLITAVDIET